LRKEKRRKSGETMILGKGKGRLSFSASGRLAGEDGEATKTS